MLRIPNRSRPQISAPIPQQAMPLAVNQLDHQISVQNGSTSVLELFPRRVQLAKLNPTTDLSTRVEELTREVGGLRYEIQFYRQCFEILQRLRDKIYNVYQQLFLANYLGHGSDRLDDLTGQLHRALEESAQLEAAGKRVWMDFWGADRSEEVAGGGKDKGENGDWI